MTKTAISAPSVCLMPVERTGRARAFFGVSIGVAVLAAGCGESSRSVASGSDIMLEMEAEDVYVLGAAEAPDWQLLGRISDLAFDGAGNLALIDQASGQSRIVVVDPEGRLLRFISRAGDGPGELRDARGVEFLGDGRLVVVDAGHQALLLFGEDGEFVEQFAIPDAAAPATATGAANIAVKMTRVPNLIGALPDGRLLELRPENRALDAIALGEKSVEFFGAYSPPEEESDITISFGEAEVSLGGLPSLREFSPPLDAAVLADGSVAVIDSVGYQVKIVGPDGAMLSVLTRAIDPVPVTQEMQEAAAQRRQQSRREPEVRIRAPGRSVPMEALESFMPKIATPEMTFASEVPVLKNIAVDGEDRIWVSRTGEDGFSTGLIDVLAVEDGYLGSLVLEEATMPSAFGPSGLMAYIDQDELDVQTVRVVRLKSLGRAENSP